MTKQATQWRVIIKNNNETVRDSRTANYNRFIQYLCLGKNLETQFKGHSISFYIKANYGKHLDNYGDMTTFENEGEYSSYKKALLAARAFQEVSLEWAKETK